MNNQAYRDDEMRADAEDYQVVSVHTRRIAQILRRKPLHIPQPRLTEMDKTIAGVSK